MILGKTIGLEMVKQTVGSSVKIRGKGERASKHHGGTGHRPNERRDCTQLKSQTRKSASHCFLPAHSSYTATKSEQPLLAAY
jgi:hypothetical protein